MKYCKTCKLFYETPLKHCLFCNSPLEATTITSNGEEQFLYPAFQKQKKAAKHFKKIMSFLLLIGTFTCIYLDLTESGKGLSWSLYTTSCLIYALLICHLFAGKKKTIKKLTSATYVTIIFLIVIAFIGHNPFWAIDFILPLGIFTLNLCLTFYLLKKHKVLHDVAIYSLVASLFGLIPFMLIFFHALTYTWPSIVCGLYSIAILFGLLFFSTKQTKEEFARRFHI